jgi:hypothetical protein
MISPHNYAKYCTTLSEKCPKSRVYFYEIFLICTNLNLSVQQCEKVCIRGLAKDLDP